ncbi:molybdopterin-dependent oxidoreductase [Ornithinibacillus salinisoli]|uniref:Molybdopterin-dependent oxidoreductase n=1 Tax=Ornithinibacillus salinisoli TaxID=1848459 RepID=A0ABW4W5Z2_9BACI
MFFYVKVEGHVQSPIIFSLPDILAMPAKKLEIVLECAGNKRKYFWPDVYGEQWGKGAMSQGVWKGVSLQTLFTYTGIINTAKEVVFQGFDYGKRTDSNEKHHFSRSLSVQQALHPDTILAYQYNEKALTLEHGFPLRLIVPSMYAMASVKWVNKIEVIDHNFNGSFQKDDYVY